MRYYMGSSTDPLYAVYEREGVCYPVFAEKYGTQGFPFRPELEEITDAETVGDNLHPLGRDYRAQP